MLAALKVWEDGGGDPARPCRCDCLRHYGQRRHVLGSWFPVVVLLLLDDLCTTTWRCRRSLLPSAFFSRLPFPISSSARCFVAGVAAQTDFNKLEVCQGRRLNPPLNEKGRGQARDLLVGTELSAILCSPLRRARETAGIVRERCEIDAVVAPGRSERGMLFLSLYSLRCWTALKQQWNTSAFLVTSCKKGPDDAQGVVCRVSADVRL